MLKDAEVKRFIEAITEYKELLDHSSDMRDQLESLHKRWHSLKQERDELRTNLDRIHQTMSQMKADYQVMMKRVTDLFSTEDMVLDNVRFLIIELDSTLRKYEDAT
jgi:predicted nuclease with TOPRIM domain